VIRIGVISNPRSRANRRGLQHVAPVLAGHPHARHYVLEEGTELSEILSDCARRALTLLAINGGDGTVQAVLTGLYADGPFETPPALALLRGGTSNTIARNLGVTGRPAAALARLLARAARRGIEDVLVANSLLRVDHPARPRPAFGLFFAAAGLARAILHRRRIVPHPWVPDPLAAALTALSLLGDWITHRSPGERVIPGDPIAIDLDGEPHDMEPCFLVMVTTLERIFLSSRPFWGSGPGRLRFTSVRYPPARFAASVLPLLYGKNAERRKLPDGYVSRNTDTVALRMSCPCCLDGEFLDSGGREPIVLSAGPVARFVRL
jgi:hypothetical protein